MSKNIIAEFQPLYDHGKNMSWLARKLKVNPMRLSLMNTGHRRVSQYVSGAVTLAVDNIELRERLRRLEAAS